MDIKASVLQAIGNTPLVRLNKLVPKGSATILAKCEFLNPTGSIKDRMACFIIEQAEKKGLLKPGGTIVEATSGNTGLGLAMVAAVKGYKCIFTMPDKMSKEKQDMLKAYGAKVVITPTAVTHDAPDNYVQVAKKIVSETPNSFYVDQYKNLDNVTAHYNTTAKEIWEQTEGKFDAFVSGSGTGGTISGVGRYIKERNKEIQVVLADPAGSVNHEWFYNKQLGDTGVYKVEGIGQDFVCDTLDFNVIDRVVQTKDPESFNIARRLVREEGLFCGGSAGSTVSVALELARELGAGKTVVVILTDSGSRYISKHLNDDWMKANAFDV